MEFYNDLGGWDDEIVETDLDEMVETSQMMCLWRWFFLFTT